MFARVRRKTNGLWARAEQAEPERFLKSVRCGVSPLEGVQKDVLDASRKGDPSFPVPRTISTKQQSCKWLLARLRGTIVLG